MSDNQTTAHFNWSGPRQCSLALRSFFTCSEGSITREVYVGLGQPVPVTGLLCTSPKVDHETPEQVSGVAGLVRLNLLCESGLTFRRSPDTHLYSTSSGKRRTNTLRRQKALLPLELHFDCKSDGSE